MEKIITVFEGASCCDVWLQTVTYLAAHGTACNIVLGIEKPDVLSPTDFQVQARVNDFLVQHGTLPISTIATTIFPCSEYLHGGASEVFNEFPKLFKKFHTGWGTYAGRMLNRSLREPDGDSLISPLERVIKKMKRQLETGQMRSVYEISLLDNEDLVTDITIYNADTDSRPIRGLPCLSHLSFKLLPGKITLTAMYRYHFYVQKALGNLLGLAQLLAFVAAEVGVAVGPLICHSTYAVLDTQKGLSRGSVQELIDECRHMTSATA